MAIENSNPENKFKKKRKRSKKLVLLFVSNFCVDFLSDSNRYGAILNVTKIISYQGKMVTLKNLLKSALDEKSGFKIRKKDGYI